MIKKEYYNIETAPMVYHNIVKVFLILLEVTILLTMATMEFLVNFLDLFKEEVDFVLDEEGNTLIQMLQSIFRIDTFTVIYYTISIFLILITIIGLFKMKWNLLYAYVIRYILLLVQNIISIINITANYFTPISNILVSTIFIVLTSIYYLKRRPLFTPYEMTPEEELIYKEQEKVNVEKKEEEYKYSI